MADKYLSFKALQVGEPPGSFSIVFQPTAARLAVVAPHAGGIEPGTSEVSRLIADGIFSLYMFEGTKKSDNGDLHITSTRFDEPQCLKLLEEVEVVLAIHGEERADEETVFLGGLHEPLMQTLRARLAADGFAVKSHATLQGNDPANICNRGRSRQGVQLELSKGLRGSFFESLTREGRKKQTPRLDQFCECIRAALFDGQLDGPRST